MTLGVGRIPALSLIALALVLPAAAETPALQTGGRVELAAGRIVIEAAVPSSAFAEPRARHRAERDLEAGLPDLFMRFAPSLIVDSWDTLGLVAQDSEAVLTSLKDLSREGRLEGSHMSEDLRTVRLAWSFPLFGGRGLFAALATHARPFPLPRSLADAPTTRYSGVVIYAAEPVPARGTTEDRLPRPALFPKIYDTTMSLVLEKGMCDPASLARWGMVAYTDDPAAPGPADRIGPNPLRILARGVFGRNDTDLLIPAESAHRLLGSEDNRRLLREGRILVIYSSVSPALAAAPR
jgi:hypothetical protein